MPFPISLSGAVTARNVTVEQAVDRLEAALARASAGSVRRGDRSIEFSGSPWLTAGWANALRAITRGMLDVSASADGVNVKNRVTFTGALVFATAAVALLGWRFARGPQVSAAVGLGWAAFAWLWLMGMTFLMTRWRLRRFLLRSLSAVKR